MHYFAPIIRYNKNIFVNKFSSLIKYDKLCTSSVKGSDRLCKVVELSMQYCGKLLSDSFETY